MIGAIGGAGIAGAPAKETGKIRDGATQFEALLVAQMLRSARESGGGLMGEGGSQTDSTMMEMAEGCFAEMLTARGGLGLGGLIEQHLSRAPAPGSGTAIPAKNLKVSSGLSDKRD